jgi:two-component system, NarL family, response regulator NreC
MKRVLIVDDHKIFREGLKSMIDKNPDIEVVGEADSGVTAIKMFQELLPDIIIMDIVMPEMNGIDTTRHIIQQTPKAIIIGLSMHEDARFASEMLKAGASGFLLKDCAFKELVDAMNTVMEGDIYLSPQMKDALIKFHISLLSNENSPSASVLSPRELEILKLIADGRSMKEIAAQLGLSVKTIEAHRQNIMEKLNLRSIAELIKYAIREGLTSL